MKKSNFSIKGVMPKAFNAYFKNPGFIFLFVLTYFILSFFVLNSFIKFSNLYSEYAYLIFSGLVFLLIISFSLSIFIGGAHLALKSKFSIKEALKFYKFTFGNFVLLVMLRLLLAFGVYVSSKAGYLTALKFSDYLLFPFYYVSFFVYFIFCLLLIFLTFQNFYFTLENENIFNSIKKSFTLVKKNYFKVLFILLIYLALDFLISKIPYVFAQEIVNYVFIYPLWILILASLFENVRN